MRLDSQKASGWVLCNSCIDRSEREIFLDSLYKIRALYLARRSKHHLELVGLAAVNSQFLSTGCFSPLYVRRMGFQQIPVSGRCARIDSLASGHSFPVIDRNNGRNHVAWDIETTGFGADDVLSVAGFWFPDGHAVLFLNVYAEACTDTSELEQQLSDRTEGVDVTVYLCEGGREILVGIRELLFDRFSKDYDRLIAYNAESWKGGFDLPFVRTRCIKFDLEWVFDDIQFADLYDPLAKRINTTVTSHSASADANTLTGSHELLAPSQHSLDTLSEYVPDDHPWYVDRWYDPFKTSASAVDAYHNENHLDVLLHNLSDIHRTWELGELIRHYVPSKDISTKKL